METHIEFWQNIPFFCIMISMFSGIISSVLKKEAAKRLNTVVIGTVVILSAILLVNLLGFDGSYTYMMLYLFGSLALGLLAVLAGHYLAKCIA